MKIIYYSFCFFICPGVFNKLTRKSGPSASAAEAPPGEEGEPLENAEGQKEEEAAAAE